ncbi:S-layer homology domain-containing protein [Paenibacillus sepulcri]|uniref:S-layer homology domain-containing protein n=1 Tax=Paenibacillus sepulcri TaxID=359917 RepID=A0ABS7CAJ8_9BACL|nr:S-layer homology domain-containing protein [Paenibacillus sepulcri]
MTIIKTGKYNPAAGSVEFKAEHFSKYALGYADISFGDLKKSEWAIDAIETLAARGIINGDGNGNFNPGAAVTRAEFITMLMSAFDLAAPGELSTFRDVKEKLWYSDSITSAQKLGIVKGRTDGSFGVNDPVSRQDMAVMVYKIAELQQIELQASAVAAAFADRSKISAYAAEAVDAMQQSGIIEGMGGGRFAPKEPSTRAQAAVIINRLFQKQ